MASSAGPSAARSVAPAPSAAPLASTAGDHRDLAHREDEVEVVDRLGDEPEEQPGQLHAEDQPDHRAQQGDEQGLGHDEPEHLAACDAERAQHADERPALDHRERHGVVDEEDADDRASSESAVRFSEKARVRRPAASALAPARTISTPGGRACAMRSRAARARGVVGEDEVDAAQPSRRAQELLRSGDVGDEEVLERATGEVVAWLDPGGHRDRRAGRRPRG